MEEPQEIKNVPPYLPYKTFKNFLEGLRVAMPARIDRSIMGSLSGGAQKLLIAALKYLSLTNASDAPTEKLTRLVNSSGGEWQKVFKDIVISGYGFIFKDGLDLMRATPRQLDEQFETTGASGDTVRKCVAFFIAAAKDAEIQLSPHITKAKRGTRPTNNRSKRVSSVVTEPSKMDEVATETQAPAQLGWSQMLLSKFPTFDPAWPPEVQAKWFDSFEKLMKVNPQDGADIEDE
ncbi:MAG: hypothetical protein UZ03_NOB001000881 [Nitrospira sp. OLB3]|nr:MAG: hypothetical protein UZ03_NOB001000881 [Nitrospira sp. OLB3]